MFWECSGSALVMLWECCGSALAVQQSFKLKRMAALEHIGAQLLIVLVLIGLVLAETFGDVNLPDLSMIMEQQSDNGTEAILSGFVGETRAKTRNIIALNRLMALAWILATVRCALCYPVCHPLCHPLCITLCALWPLHHCDAVVIP